MKSWNLLFMLLYCSGAFCSPSEPTSSPVKDADHRSELSSEDSVPTNMNLADYYYSIFGKHLDYDYREPLLTFDEPTQNVLSDEILSEVDKGSDPWDTHSRKKRFILVPANFYNSTRRWAQNMRRLRMERRRLRTERRRQWQQTRIQYLQSRSEALQKQAERLRQLQQRQVTRSVPEQQQQESNTVYKIALSTTTSSKPTKPTEKPSGNAIDVNSDAIPIKQVPIPTTT